MQHKGQILSASEIAAMLRDKDESLVDKAIIHHYK
jgi:hypothetical protein